MQFEDYLKNTGEYGIVEEVFYPICKCSGLPGARVSEIIIFEEGGQGKVLTLNKDSVEILIFSDSKITVGSKVARTGEFLHVLAGEQLLGKVIDPLGNLYFEDKDFKKPTVKMDVDIHPDSISARTRIKKQLVTGITLIDQLIPLGMGQRELIVGDRKTGKTGTILSIIKHQVELGTIVVYAAIGKRSIEIKKLKQDFENVGILKNVCIVASSSSDSPSLVDLSPYSAMGIADYFKSIKKDVLIVFDDLSTHAKYYREISLIAKKFPGRDSYPGDIFYKHAKLLERAGNYLVDGGDVSITALPVAETVEGELTDYITSNLISITDGHILFDQNSFNKGIRPAVNVFLSVTRVGKQTQTPLCRDTTRTVLEFLTKYDRALEFSHFGSELSPESKQVLTKGEKMYKLFEQNINQSIPLEVQLFLISVIWNDLLPELKPSFIPVLKDKILNLFNTDKSLKADLQNIFKLKNFVDYSNKIVEQKEKYLKVCRI